jgi:hypothetical protein
MHSRTWSGLEPSLNSISLILGKTLGLHQPVQHGLHVLVLVFSDGLIESILDRLFFQAQYLRHPGGQPIYCSTPARVAVTLRQDGSTGNKESQQAHR